VNVTFAQDRLESDLGFSGAVYGFGAGVFFIAYFFLEVPSNLALHRFGARKWIARIMITWGLISACTMFVKGPLSFYLVRFLLGMAEAGFFPGMILYLSYWFPARERARAVGFFMSAIAISYAIGAPISGGIMSVFDGVAGLKDWQWLFIIEAIPALLAGVFVLSFLDDGPEHADWLPEDDIVHLILDAVALMDLSAFEATHKLGGAGQAPFAPAMLLSVLIYAYSHGVRSSRAIERLCGRDAGYRFIVGEHVPDHTVIARFRRRHIERLEAIFVRVLEMCRDAGLIRLGLVVLDGTKVKANASLEANRSAATIDQQVARLVAEAESTDRREDRLFGPDGRETLAVAGQHTSAAGVAARAALDALSAMPRRQLAGLR